VTPEELALVQSSFARASDSLDELTERFYAGLFEREPSLRALFGEDMTAQRGKLADQLVAIVAAVSRLDQLVALTKPLGARHVDYGVEPHHYEVVGEALFAALEAVLGDEWDVDVEAAWVRAYDLVVETMLIGATTGAD
jgi:hemoglobin-like flavoprotein